VIVATLAAWSAFGAAVLLGGFDALPPWVLVVCAAVAVMLSLLMAGRTLLSIWRGPAVVAFQPAEAERCAREEAARIRSAAQLRGTMGGAGHVHPARLAFPAMAWLASAALGAALALDEGTFALVAAAAVGLCAGARVLCPPSAFFYREASDGSLVVFPPAACGLLRAPSKGHPRPLEALSDPTPEPESIHPRVPAGSSAPELGP
jgi:hypothetical protein